MFRFRTSSFFWSLCIVVVSLVLVWFVAPPQAFPRGMLVEITEGTVNDVAEQLVEQRVVRFGTLFKLVVVLSGQDETLRAGTYLFETPASVIRVALRLVDGAYGLTPVRIRVPEGVARADIAALFTQTFPHFDAEHFLELTEDQEGFLFPDTYFFLPTVQEEEVVRTLLDTFERRFSPLRDRAASSTYTMREIVTLASLIEREVSNPTDQRLVSGVLQNRLAIDMPLQVDATLYFLFGKASHELTSVELEADSPYNTYRHRGLPPGPIASPGFGALEAVLSPEPSPYFFYLSDADGITHYAEDFETHKQNKERYLR